MGCGDTVVEQDLAIDEATNESEPVALGPYNGIVYMDFTRAFQKMQAGKFMRRPHWETGEFIYVQEATRGEDPLGGHTTHYEELRRIAKCGSSHAYSLTNLDLFADDWLEYKR